MDQTYEANLEPKEQQGSCTEILQRDVPANMFSTTKSHKNHKASKSAESQKSCL